MARGRLRRVLGVLAGAALLALAGAPAAQAAIRATGPSTWLDLDGSIRYNPAAGGSHDWANSGAASPLNSCPAGAVDLNGAGGLFNCGSPGPAGGPPNPPALTPAAAADPSIISAAFIVDPISSDTTACGSGDPSVIAGGGKNGDPIGSYSLTTQSVPDKDDLGNVYAVSHTRADTGRPELFFAAERLVNNGDSHIDFEFLQSRVSITNTCAGSFTGQRTEGDLLAAVDFTGGGATAGITLYQWHCVAEPGPQPADGTVCDPAGTTPPEHYQTLPTPPALNFLVNAADVPCGGWICRDKLSGSSAVVSARDFLEGGIDLQEIPFTGCFNTFLPHTRTAQSFTSGLKDFTGPAGIDSCRTPALASSAGPGGTVAPGATVSDAFTAGSGGAGFTPTGTVSFFLCDPALVTAAGCPSGGAPEGTATLVAGSAGSNPATVSGLGTYCWRAEYAPDANSTGVYLPSSHTNAGSECFTVAAAPAPPGFPNTGGGPAAAPRAAGPAPGDRPWWPLLATGLLLGLASAAAWRRLRAAARARG